MPYTPKQIEFLVEEIRQIDLDVIGPQLIRLAGVDGLGLINFIREQQTDTGVARIDLVFGLPHRNLNDEYNREYTIIKESLGRLSPFQMADLQALCIKGLTGTKYAIDVINSL